MHVYLGVDGGNSETRALLIDAEGSVCGYGTGGNANHQGQGIEQAMEHVAAAAHAACQAADIAPDGIACAHFALAGDDVVDDHTLLTDGLGAAFPGLRFVLSNDVWAGLRAGSLDGTGVAVNCGSGCGAVGYNARGDKVIIPDLGYNFGDSGGGVQIAVDAVRAVIRSWDGRGEPTALTGLVLDLMEQPSVDELYLAMYRRQLNPRRFRALTRLVFQAASGGDAVADGILRRIGDELGVAAAAIARRLRLRDDPFTFVLTGGAIRTLSSPLAQAAIARLRATAPGCQPTLPVLMPAGGAALQALDAASMPVTGDHYRRLRAQGHGWHPEESFVQ